MFWKKLKKRAIGPGLAALQERVVHLEEAAELQRKLDRAELLRDQAVEQCEQMRRRWLEEQRESARLRACLASCVGYKE